MLIARRPRSVPDGAHGVVRHRGRASVHRATRPSGIRRRVPGRAYRAASFSPGSPRRSGVEPRRPGRLGSPRPPRSPCACAARLPATRTSCPTIHAAMCDGRVDPSSTPDRVDRPGYINEIDIWQVAQPFVELVLRNCAIGIVVEHRGGLGRIEIAGQIPELIATIGPLGRVVHWCLHRLSIVGCVCRAGGC
jgi:hypothetical protein